MLLTPLGAIKVLVNDKEVEFTPIKLDNLDVLCPNVNARYSIQYEYKKEFKNQEIKCCIPSLDVKGEIESGERLEAISFYKNDIKLTIGIEGEFTDYPQNIDYGGEYLNDGIQYVVFKATADRRFNFGVCWIQPCTEENDIQTWFGADPNFMPES
ncbi:hypothetical protein SFC65_19990 [Priestia filamentosa]|uniref:hypothetical protein n=1 Tax=Priestia filamentosa TaxID=1402861 RepID=UPI0039823880